MKNTNGYIYFNKGIFLYQNHLNEWAVSSKNESVYLELFETEREAIDYVLTEHNAQFLDYEELSPDKLEILKGFYASLYYANFTGGGSCFNSGFWATSLDCLHIPRFVQNMVAELAGKRESNFKYLRPQIETIWNDWLNWLNQKAA